VTDVLDRAVRCSAWARAESLDPIGTVGSNRGFLLVEVPLPWPRDIGLIPALADLGSLAAEMGIRIQALVPPSRSSDRRVILYTATDPDGWFSGLRRRSATVPTEQDLAGAVEALAGSTESSSSSSPDSGAPGRDLLVCTHGRRDVCCGSSGTELALRLTAEEGLAGVTVWRTSHTGGHRFAPTFLLFPDATGWAFADPELVHQVTSRSVPFAHLAPHYRGCAGLPGPGVQALEREVLASEGWEVMDRPRRGFETGEADPDGWRVVRLEVADGLGGIDSWEARVGPGRVLPVPDCGRPLSEAKKTDTEWAVADLRRA
jgi:hypothetical protein